MASYNRLPSKSGKPLPTAKDKFEAPKFKKLPASGINPEVVYHGAAGMFHCDCCNEEFVGQKENFYTSSSVLWRANNGYFPICKECLNGYYLSLVEEAAGDNRKAITRIAQLLDIYLDDDLMDMALKAIEEKTSVVGRLISKSHLHQYTGKTFMDTIADNSKTVFNTVGDLEAIEEGEYRPPQEAIDLFGLGYEADEYEQLLGHYKTLTKQFSAADAIQESLIKDLCNIKVLQNKAMRDRDLDSFDKLTKLYQSTLKAGNLKTRSEESDGISNENICWGTFIRDIEQYTPADLYQDDKMFGDEDSIADYFKRFILRPVINFFTGSRELDQEYSLSADETGDEST